MTDNDRVTMTIGGKRWEGVLPASRRSCAIPDRAKNRSLVLVHPPQLGLMEGFSSGLVALANHVSRSLPDVHVTLLDLGLAGESQLGQRVQECIDQVSGQLFVGITTTTASYRAALSVAETVKDLVPKAVVIMGGHHASAQDDVILRNHRRTVDLVIRGEGEIALTALLKCYPETEHVPSLTYIRGHNETIRTEPAPLLDQSDLDHIGVTFRGWGLQSAPGKFDHTTYVSARGCPLKCAFCSVANERIRNKSVAAVIQDLRVLVGDMGFRNIAIEDNFFAHSPKRTIALCQAIAELQQELQFNWDCQTRVESCQREDVMSAMESAGCEAVYLGVESFDPEHLLYLNKTRQPGTYLRLLRHKVVPWLLRSRINCYINLQLGLPGEAAEHRENTLRLLSQLGQQAELHGKKITIFPQLHVVYPGTGHFHQALTEGRYGPNSEDVFEEFTRWEAQRQPILRWLGEHFAHGTGGIPEGILNASMLKQGRFQEDTDAIFEVINYLTAMANTPGIRVFKYGRYLAGNRDSRATESFKEAMG